MSMSSLLEPDLWPQLYREIVEKREEQMEALVHVNTLEQLREKQGFIRCLDWLIDEAKAIARPPQHTGDTE